MEDEHNKTFRESDLEDENLSSISDVDFDMLNQVSFEEAIMFKDLDDNDLLMNPRKRKQFCPHWSHQHRHSGL